LVLGILLFFLEHCIFLAAWQKLKTTRERFSSFLSKNRMVIRGSYMKRIGNIYEKICDINNIKLAIIEASKGKRSQTRVSHILKDIDFFANKIQEILLSKNYIPSQYIKKSIVDSSSGKQREICKPKFFPDQIIHWALILQIKNIIMRGMYFYNCGSIPNRGSSFCQKAMEGWIRKDVFGTKHCLKMDISKFYPSINNELLKQSFRRIIKDKDCLCLIDSIINSHNGLPIGNYTSQWFANYFLQSVDHFIKEDLKIRYYVRYIDDMVLLDSNKKKLRKARRRISDELKLIGLNVKSNWQIFSINKRPIDFLGLKFYRAYTTLRKRNSLRIKRRIKKIYMKDFLNYRDACATISYWGWIKRTNSYNFYIKNFKPYVSICLARKVVSNYGKRKNI